MPLGSPEKSNDDLLREARACIAEGLNIRAVLILGDLQDENLRDEELWALAVKIEKEDLEASIAALWRIKKQRAPDADKMLMRIILEHENVNPEISLLAIRDRWGMMYAANLELEENHEAIPLRMADTARISGDIRVELFALTLCESHIETSGNAKERLKEVIELVEPHIRTTEEMWDVAIGMQMVGIPKEEIDRYVDNHDPLDGDDIIVLKPNPEHN